VADELGLFQRALRGTADHLEVQMEPASRRAAKKCFRTRSITCVRARLPATTRKSVSSPRLRYGYMAA
jgi:hypothetical protein